MKQYLEAAYVLFPAHMFTPAKLNERLGRKACSVSEGRGVSLRLSKLHHARLTRQVLYSTWWRRNYRNERCSYCPSAIPPTVDDQHIKRLIPSVTQVWLVGCTHCHWTFGHPGQPDIHSFYSPPASGNAAPSLIYEDYCTSRKWSRPWPERSLRNLT
jgi:hypothetical protein